MSFINVKQVKHAKTKSITREFEQKLIMEVKNHSCIYAKNEPEYFNKICRTIAWEDIALIVGKTVDECQKKWTSLRDSFRAYFRRDINVPSGAAAKPAVKWVHFESLKFLIPYIKVLEDNALLAPSAVSSYNGPDATTHCGEVHCCQTLLTFTINCTKCTSKFSLRSFRLFIEHIQKCRPSTIPELESENIIQDLRPDVTDDSTDIIQADRSHNDPLEFMKMEVDSAEEMVEPSIEPIVYQLNLETINDDRDQCTVNEGIIKEYKKHPLLWDVDLFEYKTATMSDKALHYYQIRKAINTKYNTAYSDSDIRSKIYWLTSEYIKALKQKNPLWSYYDKMRFIKLCHSKNVEAEQPHTEQWIKQEFILKVEDNVTEDIEAAHAHTGQQVKDELIPKLEDDVAVIEIKVEPTFYESFDETEDIEIDHQYRQQNNIKDDTGDFCDDELSLEPT